MLVDPEAVDLLKHLGTPLVRAARMDPEGVKFHVILNPVLNAFALPGGHVVLHSGLIHAMRTPGELSGVLAHEIGHLAAGHHVQMASTGRNISIGTLIAMATGLAAGIASGNAGVAQASIMGGAAAGQSAMLGMMRQREQQSDQLAVRYMALNGMDPAEMASFMDRLNREQRMVTMPPPYLLTHPINSQRLMDIRDLVQQTPISGEPATDQQQARLRLWLARAQIRIEAATVADPGELVTRFSQRLPGAAPGHDRLVLKYGLAIAHRYAGQLPEAAHHLAELLQERPEDPYLLREHSLVLSEQGHYPQAEAGLRRALGYLPDHRDLRYHLAFVLGEQHQYAQATGLLRQLTNEDPDDARPFYLLGVLEGKKGQSASSHLALARHHRLAMDIEAALWHYREALALLPKGSPDHTAATGELVDFRKQLQEMPPES
jgi:predicted Zn-dependent protease